MQYKKEVNELHAERLAKNANPLALVATTHANQDPSYQTSKSHKSYAPSSKPSIPTRSHTTTRYKGKEIAKPITPPFETAFEEDNDPEQAQRDKDMQKNLALIAKYLKKIYKPTNNNLRTSSNSRNMNVDTTLRYKNDNQSGQFGNQRTMNVAGARENVGSPVVQQSRIQCSNRKEFGHFAKECRKSKRVKDSAYHKEKMLLCKQAKQGAPLQAEQYDWLADMDEEIDEQELEAYYSYVAKIQEVPTADSGTDSEPLEQNEQNDVESDDERVALANLKLDVDENKKIQKQLKKANTTLAQELKECKTILSETSNALGESISQEMHDHLKYVESLEKEIDKLESDKAEFSNMYDMILQECVSKDVMCSYLLSLSDLDSLAELQCVYLHKVKECDYLAQIFRNKLNIKELVKNDTVWNEKASNVFRKERKQYFKIQDLKAQLQDKNIAISELKKLIEKGKGKSMDTKFDKPSVVRQPNAQRIPKPSVLEDLSKPVTAQTLPQTARQAIVQLIIFIVDSGCTKHMTGNLKLLCNFVDKFMGTVRFGNDQFARILVYGDLVQENVTINRVYYIEGLNHNLFSVGQFCDADLEVAFRKSTCFVRDLQGNDLLIDNLGTDLYKISLQELTSSTPFCIMAKATPTQAWLWHRILSHLNFDYINLLSKKDVVIGLPKLKYIKDQLCSSYELSKAKRISFKSKVVPSSKGRLNFLHKDLCGPMWVASINGKKYILMIVDEYSRYTWTLFLRSKDETPEVLKEFLTMI
nr:retrovirus-related Pol polyprotein from transposon TNT 1-94 [Tanacetum cinerariifolium]